MCTKSHTLEDNTIVNMLNLYTREDSIIANVLGERGGDARHLINSYKKSDMFSFRQKQLDSFFFFLF